MSLVSSDLPIQAMSAIIYDHNPSRRYKACEVVLKDGVQYRATSDIDGTSTPVPFVEGTGDNKWERIS